MTTRGKLGMVKGNGIPCNVFYFLCVITHSEYEKIASGLLIIIALYCLWKRMFTEISKGMQMGLLWFFFVWKYNGQIFENIFASR